MAAISTKGSPTTTGWSRRPAPADEQLQLPRSSPSEIQVVSETTGMYSQGAVRSGPDAPQLLSTADVSKALGVAEITVRRLIRSGELARIKIGKRTLVHPADVVAFVDARRAKTSKSDDGAEATAPTVEETADEPGVSSSP